MKTYTAIIYVGLKNRHTGDLWPMETITNTVRAYVQVGLCVTVTPLTFYYVNGSENGVAVGLINYPRFPSSKKKILNHAKQLGRQLLENCQQDRVSIVCSDKTIMLNKSGE